MFLRTYDLVYMEVYLITITYFLPCLDIKTVKSFLEFIYADKTKRIGRDFDASKYTALLLKMAHMYQCQGIAFTDLLI